MQIQLKRMLQGTWKFGFEKGESAGEKSQGLPELNDTIELPSTTEISKKGSFGPKEGQTLFLSRKYPFTGRAHYEREIEIPKEWAGHPIFLFLERTKYTEVYVDGKWVSGSHETLIPQRHELTEALGDAGKHLLRIVVDNDLASKEDFPESLLKGHQYTEHTQTNWNGILGEIYLEKGEEGRWEIPQIVGDENAGGFFIRTREGESITVWGYRSDGLPLAERELKCSEIQGTRQAFYALWQEGEDAQKKTELLCLWDEFHPVFYRLFLIVTDKRGGRQQYEQNAGIFGQEIRDKRIVRNGVPVFLRGTVDCCIYPRTGACPMDKESWLKIFDLYQQYGLNHCRFHSWCPPEAAFAAADEKGIYLQVELSNFAAALYGEKDKRCDKALYAYIYDQAKKVLAFYGNHPSFLLFAAGNEMTGDLREFERLIRQLRSIRPDKLYTQGANNFLEHPVCSGADDCWIIMRTDEKTNIRASFSFGDLPLGYLQTQEEPSTLHDYSAGVGQSPLPLISHEIGQYQCYPNYREIPKYTGPLSPENLKQFQKRLEEAGMGDMADRFFQASGRLAVQCYREEIEAALRTRDMAGFQLLGLQDFPGQGTALVGILDSFLDSKGLITPEEFRRFCAPRVLLAKFPRYVWQEQETFEGEIFLADFGPESAADAAWRAGQYDVEVILYSWENQVLGQAHLKGSGSPGKLTALGPVHFALPRVEQAAVMRLVLRMGEVENEYPLWIYKRLPEKSGQDSREKWMGIDSKRGIFITDRLDQSGEDFLKQGGRVVLFSDKAKEGYSVPGAFAPDFWCWPMFRDACVAKGLPVAPGTLGMVCDSAHPAFRGFPTEDYAQWQWQPLLYNSRPVILDGWGAAITPIVQIIDNFERNHKLSYLLEARVKEGGSLLFCAGDVLGHMDRPQVRQFYESIVAYAASEDFAPAAEIALEEIKSIFVDE